MVQDLSDPRRVEPDDAYEAHERTLLETWLDFHRATLLLKCEGLSDEERKARPVATSKLSLHGLVRHMAEVERHWFRRAFLRDPDLPQIDDPDGEDLDFAPLDTADWDEDRATWEHEIEQAKEAVRGRPLTDTGLRRGKPVSLRWMYNHMIEEYARHNGHADLIREMVDGAVGW